MIDGFEVVFWFHKKKLYLCSLKGTKSIDMPTKINILMQSLPRSSVLLLSWLLSQGYSYELQKRYRKSGWLKSIGKGAMLLSRDSLVLAGALSTLQNVENLNAHIGGRSALELHGFAHYLQINSYVATLFVNGRTKLPLWFTNNEWDTKTIVYRLSLFEDETVGMVDYQQGELTMKISSPARAIMECLALCPKKFQLQEAYEIMEALGTMRPVKVQELLENCKSVKVKRLFLYFAEKANHSWFKHLKVEKIDLGAGNRTLGEGGFYDSKYKLNLPKNIV